MARMFRVGVVVPVVRSAHRSWGRRRSSPPRVSAGSASRQCRHFLTAQSTDFSLGEAFVPVRAILQK